VLIKRAGRKPGRRTLSTAFAPTKNGGLDRRDFLRRSGLAAGAAAAFGTVSLHSIRKAEAGAPPPAGTDVTIRKNVCTHCSVGCTVIAKVANGVWTGQEPGWDSPIKVAGVANTWGYGAMTNNSDHQARICRDGRLAHGLEPVAAMGRADRQTGVREQKRLRHHVYAGPQARLRRRDVQEHQGRRRRSVRRGHPARDQSRRLVDRLLRPVAGAAQEPHEETSPSSTC
jgi:hypothetical protein